MTGGYDPSGQSAREAHRVRLGAGVPRPLRSDSGTEQLYAICFGCGLERTDSPLVYRDRLMACLVCGDTRMILDVRPAGSTADVRGRGAGPTASSPQVDPPSDLAPESRAIFAMADELGLLDHDTSTVEGLRSLARAERSMMGPPLTVGSVEDRAIQSTRGSLRIRVYRPPGEPPRRAILWLHGGGWVTGDLDHADNDCRGLCLETRSTVVSVDYGLAPEHRFPEGLEDAYSALEWLSAELASVPCTQQLVVGGDSAGGNLAAAVCLMARERGGPKVDNQLLLYPVTSSECDTSSHRDFAEGYLLTREMMQRFWSLYTRAPDAGRDSLASVLRATELHGLPAATFVVAGCDVLRDEAESYAERLRLAGVPVEVLRYPGQLHGFWTYRGASDIAKVVNAEIRGSLDATR